MFDSKVKIVLFFANYGPYHLSRLKGCFNLTDEVGWQIIPLELTQSGIAYEWETQQNQENTSIISVLGNKEPDEVTFPKLVKDLYSILENTQPNVIAIAGYFRPAMLAALAWGRYHKISTILLSESKQDDFKRNPFIEIIKAQIVKRYNASLVGGKTHKQYLLNLGTSSESVFFGYNVVGNDVFNPDNIGHLPRPVERPYFLAINRFIPKKNLLFLLDAYANYRKSSNQNTWDLVLCGSGQLKKKIEQKIQNLGLTDSVHLSGFLQQEELLPYFSHAHCFIHASLQEQWGLVVNEAMAAGLPVLVSNRCGCFEDLVVEGVNGFGFNPDDITELKDLMLKMSSPDIDLTSMSQASLKHIQKYSPEYFAQGLKQAVEYTLNKN